MLAILGIWLLPLCCPLVSVRAAPVTFDSVFAPFVTAVGQDISGTPISPMITRDGMRYQYTQYGRLESPAGKDATVQLSPAGVILSSGRTFKQLQSDSVNPDTRYFPQTQHSLAYGFRSFWEQHGAEGVLGLPISEEFAEINPADNKQYTVQYFERAELVRHPEFAGTPKEIQLGPLGNQLYQFFEGTRLPGGDDTPVPGILTPGKPAFGIVTEFTNQPRAKLLNTLGDLGVSWVRQPVNWSALEPMQGMYDFGGLELLINDLTARSVNVLLTVSNSPSWATATGDHGSPRDPADFARFMHALATKFTGRVAAYEVWNEPNLALEWGPRVNAGQYVEMLKAAYPAIKQADPHALVVAAALGPTGVMDPTQGIDDVRYLEQLEAYQNGAFHYFSDVQGTHPYGYRSAPELLYPDKPNTGEYTTHPSFYFRRIEQQRLAMIRWGDGARPMWITEFGWGSGDFPEFAGISQEQDAAWFTQAVQMIHTQYPWVGAMFLWNLNWSTFSPSDVSWGYFSILNADYSPRGPMYSAVKYIGK